MEKPVQRHMNVDVIDVLNQKLDKNTLHFKADFNYDKEIIKKAAASSCKEDKTLLWISRPMGTVCHSEYEAFIKGSTANNTYLYFGRQEADSLLLCVVELTGLKDGKILGNVYELDFRKHMQEVESKSVAAAEFVKVFEDGFADHVDPSRSSYGYYSQLIKEHGSIVESRTVPADSAALTAVLAEQKRMRSCPSLDDRILAAKAKQNEKLNDHDARHIEGSAKDSLSR